MTVKWSIVVTAAAAFAVVAPVILIIWINQPETLSDEPKSGHDNYIQRRGHAMLMRSGPAQTEVAIHSFKRCESDDAPATPGYVRYALEMSLWNDSHLTYSLDPPLQCMLIVDATTVIHPSPGGPEPALPARDMKPDDRVHGHVCYELPDGAKPACLAWGFRTFSIPAAESADRGSAASLVAGM